MPKLGLRSTFSGRVSRILARMHREGRSGSAAVEFAMIAPILFLFLCGIIETGVLFFANGALQDATDTTARMVRTGQLSGPITATVLKTNICAAISNLISTSSCTANLQVDLRSYSDFPATSYTAITNPNGSLNTAQMTVQSTATCQVILMRSFYPWTIMTPLMTTLLENMPNGQRLLTAAAAFRAEPYTSGSTC